MRNKSKREEVDEKRVTLVQENKSTNKWKEEGEVLLVLACFFSIQLVHTLSLCKLWTKLKEEEDNTRK